MGSSWLELADNAEQWARLRDAIELGQWFSLLFVVVANVEAEALAVESLRELADELGRSPVLLDARGLGDDAPVQLLLAEHGERPLAVLCTLASSSRDREAFERCFVQLNGRRDQIIERLAAPLVIIIRVDALRTLGDIAPDLFSVHAAQFRLSSAHDAGRPEWLLLPHEAFGLLGVGESFSPVSIDGMPSYLEPVPELANPLLGRAGEVGRLRAAMARNPRRLRVWGPRGVGKSSVIAAALRDLEGHYERVLWIHGWAAHTVSAVLGAIVRALDVRGRCPADPIDIEARYRELTRAQRVLIVVEMMGNPAPAPKQLPAPASPSLLIEEAPETSASADAALEIGPLAAEYVRALWAQRTAVPLPAKVIELADGRPALIELVARLWDNDGKAQYSRWLDRYPQPWVSCKEVLGDWGVLPSSLSSLLRWSCFAPAVPRRFLDLTKPGAREILDIDDETVSLAGRPDDKFDFFRRDHLLIAIARTRPPLTTAELEFVRRGLRLYTREWDFADDEFLARQHWTRDWRGAPEALAVQALESLPVDERATFAARLADVRDADEAFPWIRRATVAAVASGQLERAQRLLSNIGDTLPREQLDRVWLADHKLVLALMPPANLDDAGLARLLFEFEDEFVAAHPEAATLARVRHGLSDRDELEPAAIRVFGDAVVHDPGFELDAHAAEVTRRFDELAPHTAHPDLYAHFVHAHLCVLELRLAHWTEAKRHLDEVVDSAHTWGLAYPLLRARLLSLEFALATGDLEPAVSELDATLGRCDQLLGPLHPGSLSARILGVRIRASLGQLDTARALADDCRRRLRYTSATKSILARLWEFYFEHGPADVADQLLTRIM